MKNKFSKNEKNIINFFAGEDQKLKYRQPSLFADFLSANSLIHIDKIGQKWQFWSQKWTFHLQIQDSRSKMMERIYRE